MSTNSETLRERIHAGQSQTVATVPAGVVLGRVAALLVAFANSDGGTLVVGVSDAGTVTGVRDAQAIRAMLVEAALATDPVLVLPVPDVITLDDKTLVVARIPAGMPHVYAYDGRYHQRSATGETVTLPPRELRQLMLQRGEMTFEAQVTPGITLEAIDWAQARAYALSLSGYTADDARQVLQWRGCLVDNDGELLPTNAGLLLFGKQPQQHIVGADITAVRFGGDNMGDTFSRQDISGTLPQQIKRAETFLVDHLRKEVTLKDTMQREENYEYPMEAARELVINAVAHRDYSIHGDNIRLFIFGNRLEIHSPGGLPGHMTLDNLKEERFSRNPVIVQVLADMHFIEKLGYGVDRVMALMEAQNLQEPIFQERAGGFRVVLHNAAVKPLTDTTEKTADEAPVPPAEAAPDAESSADPNVIIRGKFRGIAINNRQEAALESLLADEQTRITNRDLQALFPDVHSETIRRDLVDLVSKGILEKRGQKRGSYYVLLPADAASSSTSTNDTDVNDDESDHTAPA